MNLEQAASKRLIELQRAGVPIPWAAAGLDSGASGSATTAGTAAAAEPVEATIDEPVDLAEPAARLPSGPAGLPAPSVDIDLKRLEKLGYLVPDLATSMAAEEFRQVKRAVLENVVRDSADNRSALIMITSAIPAEGKTFCAINLAMSIATEVDTSVLLVDGDVLRPSIFPRLGLPSPKLGLLDLLVNENIALSDVLYRTNVPKLSLLPTGTLNASASELLASGAMQRLLHELLMRYPDRVVLFDTPPLLVASSAATLATSMGQIVMVVESEATSRRQIAQAFAAVERCPNVMSVLNRCSEAPERNAYGYYYGYGHDRDLQTGLPRPKRWFGARKSKES